MAFLLNSCSNDSEPKEEPDIISPTVEFSIAGTTDNVSPGEIPVVSNQIEVNINAKDEGGISKIEAFINDEKVGEDTSAPYKIIVDISSYTSKTASTNKYKNYTLKIIVTDKAGNTASKTQQIHIDNEIPSITEVSLQENTVINSDTNIVTFIASDNEEISSATVYVNDNLLTTINDGNYEFNIDTSGLTDGENSLRIEAVDPAGNMGALTIGFISDNTGPEITLESIGENQIIDEITSLDPQVSDEYSDIASFEILNGEISIASYDRTETDYQFDFDPESHPAGSNALLFKATDNLGNESTLEIPIEIHRRLIAINIPEDRLNPAITVPVVFLSRMDGSLMVFKEILREDRRIILSIAEEFDFETEFMITFYLQDNGNAVGISTHQNLTRNNPGTINLPEYNKHRRNESASRYNATVPITNFFSNDFVVGQSGGSSHTWHNSSSSYKTYLNTTENSLSIYGAETRTTSESFSSFYLYDSYNASNYKYIFINNPIDDGFVLDKNNLTNDNIITKNLTVQSGIPDAHEHSNLQIYGALTNDEKSNNNFHQINHFNRSATVGTPMEYTLNTVFPYYKHQFLFGKYFTERNGPPIDNYIIPNISLHYTNAGNSVNLDIQGTEHIVGRIECIDFDNLHYNWSITFNSQTTTNIIIPDLPQNISHSVVDTQKNGNIKVESVELLSYESILDYNDYIEKVIKNQTNILEATEWYQLIYSSRTGNFNSPIREFIFQ